MSRTVNMAILNPALGINEHVSGTFPDDEWSVLMDFLQYANETAALKIFDSGFSTRFRLRASKSDGVAVGAEMPPDEAVAAFLHSLRPFVLQNEATHFMRVCSILAKRIDNRLFRRFLHKLRRIFDTADFQTEVKITSGTQVLNAEKTLQLWLNGFQYHRIKELQTKLLSLHEILPLESTRSIFLSMMIDKFKAVIEVAKVIQAMRDRGSQIKVLVPKDSKPRPTSGHPAADSPSRGRV